MKESTLMLQEIHKEKVPKYLFQPLLTDFYCLPPRRDKKSSHTNKGDHKQYIKETIHTLSTSILFPQQGIM